MKRIKRMTLVPVLTLLLTGCLFRGGLYSHTVVPLTFNRDATEVAKSWSQARGEIEQIQFYVTVQVGENGIGDVAKKHGIETVYYADLETRSVLFGIWREDIIHVYGR
jgi:hypothetical protein